METFWSDLLEKYRLAFTEWVKVTLNQDDIVLVESKKFDSGNEYFIISSPWQGVLPVTFNDQVAIGLPCYFDALGIRIDAAPARFQTYFMLRVFENQDSGYWLSDEGWNKYGDPIKAQRSCRWMEYPSRIEATKAGIQEAFKIREAQLKQAQENGKESN